MASIASRKRSIIYVDGFNLYYGVIRGGPHKWLDIGRYFCLLRPGDDIQVVRYFTALIDGSHRANQIAYLQALETLPLVETVLGQFKNKQVTCRVSGCPYPGPRLFATTEEKRTDVNIAISMLDDAYRGLCDRQILVSGDSDLVPALNGVKKRFPGMEIVVYVPARDRTRGAAVELRSAADKNRVLPLQILPFAQLPARVPDGGGGFIEKPASW
jgi:6-hydroxy-3-succinoylpyridine 3-monooxygenase